MSESKSETKVETKSKCVACNEYFSNFDAQERANIHPDCLNKLYEKISDFERREKLTKEREANQRYAESLRRGIRREYRD